MTVSLRHKKEAQKIGLTITASLIAFYLLLGLFPAREEENSEIKIEVQDGIEVHIDKTDPAVRAFSPKAMDLETFRSEELINHLKHHHLTPPANSDEPYNLSVSYPSYGEHDQYHNKILELLKEHHKIENGFFVEAGALDGHYLSHSLELEMQHGWNGLLVEASPNMTRHLRSKKRKCWSADVCLTGSSYMKIDYLAKKDQEVVWKRGNGKINPQKYGVKPRHYEGDEEYVSEGEVECFSLFSLLTALEVLMVDLLVLDIEGHEFEVLSNYPFDAIPIKMIAVEHWLLPMSSEVLKQFMLQKGYTLVFESSSDYVFVLK